MTEVFEIPIDNEDAFPSLKMRTILEGVEVILRMDWNTREERWGLSIFTSLEEPIVLGLPMHINTELIQRFEIETLPPGNLLLYDSTGNIEEAGIGDLGDRCKLLYETSV